MSIKTKLWRKLTWDLRIMYNKLSKEYTLERFDNPSYIKIFKSKNIKEVIAEKHKIIAKRGEDYSMCYGII